MLQQYQGQTSVSNIPYAQQPKELGVLQRIDGLHTGLGEIRERLRNFSQRLGFEPPAPPSTSIPPMESGILAQVAAAEEHLRECINALTHLNDRF